MRQNAERREKRGAAEEGWGRLENKAKGNVRARVRERDAHLYADALKKED